MNTITMLQVSRSLYKWRKILAIAVLIESLYTYKKRHSKSKKTSKSSDEIMSEISSIASRIAAQAQNYLQQAKRRM